MTEQRYAHSKQGLSRDQWHKLEDHLLGTARRAEEFAADFGSGRWGWYSGVWHDLGKCAVDWQEFLFEAGESAPIEGENGSLPRKRHGPDHSTAGAIHARRSIGNEYVARAIAFAIAGHHAGLANREDLDARLKDEEKQRRYALAIESAAQIGSIDADPPFPSFFPGSGTADLQRRRFELLIRMIYSCLVDADFLDTERFMEVDAERSQDREGWPPIAEYLGPLEAHLSQLRSLSKAAPSVVAWRSRVLDSARAAGKGCVTESTARRSDNRSLRIGNEMRTDSAPRGQVATRKVPTCD